MFEEIVYKFLSQFDEEIQVEEDTEFAYYYVKSLITYPTGFGFGLPSKERYLFKSHILNDYGLDLSDETAYVVFSLLHEMGHHMTLDDMDDEDATNEIAMREVIHLIEDVDTANQAYFKLPSEVLANDWAYEHFSEEMVKRFATLMQ